MVSESGSLKISKFNSQESSIFLAGAWNQAILNPTWLVEKIELIRNLPRPGLEVSIDTHPLVMRLVFDNFVIIPQPGVLVISLSNSHDDSVQLVQEVASSIYKLLPHTPVSAMGHNFRYDLDKDEAFVTENTNLDIKLKDRLLPIFKDNLISEYQSQLKYTLSFKGKEEFKLNISNDFNRKGVDSLQFNFHYDFSAADSEKISDNIESFKENFSIASEQVKALIVKKEQ